MITTHVNHIPWEPKVNHSVNYEYFLAISNINGFFGRGVQQRTQSSLNPQVSQ